LEIIVSFIPENNDELKTGTCSSALSAAVAIRSWADRDL
jgi:hypothetical protein